MSDDAGKSLLPRYGYSPSTTIDWNAIPVAGEKGDPMVPPTLVQDVASSMVPEDRIVELLTGILRSLLSSMEDARGVSANFDVHNRAALRCTSEVLLTGVAKALFDAQERWLLGKIKTSEVVHAKPAALRTLTLAPTHEARQFLE